MRTRTKAIGLLLLIVTTACLALVTFRPAEPQYNGKKLSFWVTRYHVASIINMTNAEARDAVRAMGAEAIPYLRKWAAYTPPDWPTYLPPGPALVIIRTLGVESRVRRSDAAIFAFSAFDTKPHIAISELMPLMRHHPIAIEALARLGNAGLPTLLTAWSNSTHNIERWPIEDAIVSHLPPDARNTNLVPLLVTVMSDTVSAHLHTKASNTLFQIAPEVATNIPAK